VLLQYYKLAKQPQIVLYLDQEENTGLDFRPSDRAAAEETTDLNFKSINNGCLCSFWNVQFFGEQSSWLISPMHKRTWQRCP